MESGNVSALLAGNSRSGGKQPTGTEVWNSPTGKPAVSESV
jgi:hypothetical protein